MSKHEMALDAQDMQLQNGKRFAFCSKHKTFPVRDQSGMAWVMYLTVRNTTRTAFIAATPEQAVDKAMQS